MRHLLTPLVVAALLVVGTACSADDAKEGAADGPSSATTSDTTTDDGTPTFTASDYTYVLVRSCYCPFTAPVAVTVTDGEVASAVARQATATVDKGDPAPESHRLTIGDIIDLAEDPAMHAQVDWPDSQAWPNRVRTDQIEGARDDEVTYEIRNVQVR